MLFRLANVGEVAVVRAFFARHLLTGNDAIYTEEFTCPLGIKAAIQRRQMFLAIEGRQIAGAARFYPKKNGEYSLYQFAVAPEFRGKALSRAMFDALRGDCPMQSLCPGQSEFNRYYASTGWRLVGTQGSLNCWVLGR